MGIVEAEGISKHYGEGEALVKSVDQVPLSIQAHEITAIVGKSGSGKTTLLHILGGLEPPDGGTVRVLGRSLYDLPDSRRTRFRREHIGFIFQKFQLIPELPVLFLTVTESLFATTREKRLDIYGAFSDLYYTTHSGEETADLLESGAYPSGLPWQGNRENTGGLYRLGEVGYREAAALSGGRLQLEEGVFPGPGQAAVTRYEAEQRGLSLGGQVSTSAGTFTVSGVLRDYGSLWCSNSSQTAEQRENPQILLCREVFAAWAGSQPEAEVTVKYMALGAAVAPGQYQEDYNLVQNEAILHSSFQVLQVILWLTYLCAGILLLQLMRMGLPGMGEKMRVYRLVGVPARQIPALSAVLSGSESFPAGVRQACLGL